jgi:hypothetical protein
LRGFLRAQPGGVRVSGSQVPAAQRKLLHLGAGELPMLQRGPRASSPLAMRLASVRMEMLRMLHASRHVTSSPAFGIPSVEPAARSPRKGGTAAIQPALEPSVRWADQVPRLGVWGESEAGRSMNLAGLPRPGSHGVMRLEVSGAHDADWA